MTPRMGSLVAMTHSYRIHSPTVAVRIWGIFPHILITILLLLLLLLSMSPLSCPGEGWGFV